MNGKSKKIRSKRALTTLNVDLNLLVVLQALLQEQSVTQAANRVCLSQSATSSALKRLRDVFDDPLLVRVSNKMELSRKGLELREPVDRAIDAINEVLGEPLAFDPLHAHATVRISASDYIGVVLLPALERELQARAPGISLHISPLREPDAFLRLERDDVDLVLGHFPDSSRHNSVELFREEFVCALRVDHPLLADAADGTISLAQFTSYPHVAIAREGGQKDLIDLWLTERDAERTVGIHVPHFLVAPSIVANSDMLTVEAKRIATIFRETFGLATLKLPIEFTETELPIHLIWEAHTDDHPCLAWLRELIVEVAKKL